MASIPEKIVEWGRPEDPWIRRECRFTIRDGILYADWTIVARGYLPQIQVRIDLMRRPWWKRAILGLRTLLGRLR